VLLLPLSLAGMLLCTLQAALLQGFLRIANLLGPGHRKTMHIIQLWPKIAQRLCKMPASHAW
jgi:hypothetical protein